MPSTLNNPLNRRQFLKLGGLAASTLALGLLLPPAALAALKAQPVRRIALTNLHTGEACALAYWEQGAYIPEALATIRGVLRDHRNNETHPIDPALLDLLAVLKGHLATTEPYEVISGYRSPESNAAMHARSGGVAKKSLHMEGKATDIRVPGRALAQVHATSLAMGMGGVGYYPTSDFVHVDTGAVRQWRGA